EPGADVVGPQVRAARVERRVVGPCGGGYAIGEGDEAGAALLLEEGARVAGVEDDGGGAPRGRAPRGVRVGPIGDLGGAVDGLRELGVRGGGELATGDQLPERGGVAEGRARGGASRQPELHRPALERERAEGGAFVEPVAHGVAGPGEALAAGR